MPKRSHEETMTEFWCRTNPYQADPTVKVHGIMYSAQQQIGPDEYVCEGSRQIGMVDTKSVWLFGGYTDVMNTEGIKIIDNRDVTKLSEHEKTEVLQKINYDLDVNSYNGYSDDESIWFYLKPPSSRRRTPGRTPGRTTARTPYKNGGKRKSRKNRK
jgi:hypothetical protein